MKFNLIALGAIALCALQQHTFAKEDFHKGGLVANEGALARDVNIALEARGLLGGGCNECDEHHEGGDLLGLELTNLLDGVLDTVGDLLHSVADLVQNLLGHHKKCELEVGHGHDGGDHDILDIGDLDLEDLVDTIGELLEKLLGGNHGLLDGVVGGLLHQILGLLETVLKSLGLDIELTDILNGEHFEHGSRCDPSTLDLNIVQTLLELVQKLLKTVLGLTGNSESNGILCQLLEAIGNLLNQLLGGKGLDNIKGPDGIDELVKRSAFSASKRVAARRV